MPEYMPTKHESNVYVTNVGISAYSDGRRVPGATNDVHLINQLIINDRGKGKFYYNDHDLLNVQAKKESILQSLEKDINKAQKGETVLFHFSGHGLTTSDGNSAICPHDYDGYSNKNLITSVELKELADKAAQKGVDFVAIIASPNSTDILNPNRSTLQKEADDIDNPSFPSNDEPSTSPSTPIEPSSGIPTNSANSDCPGTPKSTNTGVDNEDNLIEAAVYIVPYNGDNKNIEPGRIYTCDETVVIKQKQTEKDQVIFAEKGPVRVRKGSLGFDEIRRKPTKERSKSMPSLYLESTKIRDRKFATTSKINTANNNKETGVVFCISAGNKSNSCEYRDRYQSNYNSCLIRGLYTVINSTAKAIFGDTLGQFIDNIKDSHPEIEINEVKEPTLKLLREWVSKSLASKNSEILQPNIITYKPKLKSKQLDVRLFHNASLPKLDLDTLEKHNASQEKAIDSLNSTPKVYSPSPRLYTARNSAVNRSKSQGNELVKPYYCQQIPSTIVPETARQFTDNSSAKYVVSGDERYTNKVRVVRRSSICSGQPPYNLPTSPQLLLPQKLSSQSSFRPYYNNYQSPQDSYQSSYYVHKPAPMPPVFVGDNLSLNPTTLNPTSSAFSSRRSSFSNK